MAAFEDLFIRSDGPLPAEAQALADELGMKVAEKENGLFLSGPASDGEGSVGGRVYRNDYAEPDGLPEDVQAYDGYGTVFAIWTTEKSEEKRRREALRIFDELVARRPGIAMVLTHDLDLMAAAYLPGRGTHRFPDGVTVDADHEEIWRPWVAAEG